MIGQIVEKVDSRFTAQHKFVTITPEDEGSNFCVSRISEFLYIGNKENLF